MYTHICIYLSVYAEIQQLTDTVNLFDKTKGTNLALINAKPVTASRKIQTSKELQVSTLVFTTKATEAH